MRFGWLRRLTRWGVSALGVSLALFGLGAMWEGWDKIQIERGWSLFIAGSVALAGGVVTLALGAILSRLDHAILARDSHTQVAHTQVAPAAEEPAPAPTTKPAPEPSVDMPKEEVARAEIAHAEVVRKEPPKPNVAAPPRPGAKEPIEVDRYVNGDTVYVMFSDGSVEVRSAHGAQRFASLSELKAKVGEQV